MSYQDIIQNLIKSNKSPSFNRKAGKEFSDPYAFSADTIKNDPYYAELNKEQSIQQLNAQTNMQEQLRKSGLGGTTFGNELSSTAGVRAAQPYNAQKAQLAQTLRSLGFQADVTGLGLDQSLFGTATGTRNSELSALMNAATADEQQRLREEELKKKQENDFWNNILGTALGVVTAPITGGASLAMLGGNALSGLFGGKKESAPRSNGGVNIG